MIGNAAQHGVADIRSPAVFGVARESNCRRVNCPQAATRARRCGASKSLMASPSSRRWSSVEDRFGCATVSSVRASGSVKLMANRRFAGDAVGFHSPQRRHPQRRLLAIAMKEQDRRNLRGAGRGRAGLRGSAESETVGHRRQHCGALQNPAAIGSFCDLPLSFSTLAVLRRSL